MTRVTISSMAQDPTRESSSSTCCWGKSCWPTACMIIVIMNVTEQVHSIVIWESRVATHCIASGNKPCFVPDCVLSMGLSFKGGLDIKNSDDLSQNRSGYPGSPKRCLELSGLHWLRTILGQGCSQGKWTEEDITALDCSWQENRLALSVFHKE